MTKHAPTARETKTRPFDAANYLRTRRDMAGYLNAAIEEGDPALVVAALGDVARAQGMAAAAKAAGVGRTSLYKALSVEGHPEFATVLKVARALGLTIKFG